MQNVPGGFYQWDLPAGTFTLKARKDGFKLTTVEVIVSAGETSIQEHGLANGVTGKR